VVQEALTNTTKHGAPGCDVSVLLDWTPESLRITVADHAGERRRRRRTVIPSTGNGLIGLRERITAVGGQLTTEPCADGFVVAATLPITTTVTESRAA
jgi:signal transduction histidine kinase